MTMKAANNNNNNNNAVEVSQVGANVMIDGSVSPASSSSSGVSSLGTSWTANNGNGNSSAVAGSAATVAHLTEAEALLQLSNPESDEGIVSDQSSSADPEDANKRIKVSATKKKKINYRVFQEVFPHFVASYLKLVLVNCHLYYIH